MRDNLTKCPVCHKTLISEELAEHPCLDRFRGIRTIKIDHFTIIKNAAGKEEVLAFGLDGSLYSLEPSDGSLQEDYADWLRRRFDRAQKHEVYIPDNFRRKSIND